MFEARKGPTRAFTSPAALGRTVARPEIIKGSQYFQASCENIPDETIDRDIPLQ